MSKAMTWLMRAGSGAAAWYDEVAAEGDQEAAPSRSEVNYRTAVAASQTRIQRHPRQGRCVLSGSVEGMMSKGRAWEYWRTP